MKARQYVHNYMVCILRKKIEYVGRHDVYLKIMFIHLNQRGEEKINNNLKLKE